MRACGHPARRHKRGVVLVLHPLHTPARWDQYPPPRGYSAQSMGAVRALVGRLVQSTDSETSRKHSVDTRDTTRLQSVHNRTVVDK